MTINELSQKTGIPTARIKAVAAELFGTAKNLTDKQFEQIADKLQDAASIAALPPSERATEIEEIKAINPVTASEIEQTINTVGIMQLRRASQLIDNLLASELLYTKQKIDLVAEASQQYATETLSKAYTNLARDFQAIQEEFSAEQFQHKLNDVVSGKVTTIELTQEEKDLLYIDLCMIDNTDEIN